MEKYFLASNNTTNGFVSHFDSINPGENAFTYVLKGGSGTGKSTFMKKIGQYFENKGYDIEYFYCSSDPDSLDGVRIVQKSVAIVDGTSPHVTEATLPAIKDKIVNVGDFISLELRQHKKQVLPLLIKKKKMFDLCYAYLESLRGVAKAEKLLLQNTPQYATEKAEEILSQIKIKKCKKACKRKLYLSYFDGAGLCSLLPQNNFGKTIAIDSKNYFAGFDIMNKIKEKLASKGAFTIELISPLGEDLVEGLYLPGDDTLIYNNLLPKSIVNQHLFFALCKKAGKCIQKARQTHKKVEKYYVKYMNFAKLTVLREQIVQEIEQL